MTCRTLALLGAVALCALTGPARASSITTYGIIVTALGNDLQVQTVDQAGSVKPMDSALFAPSGTTGGGATDGAPGSLLVTPNGNGGVTVTPYDAAASGGVSGGGSGGKGGGVASDSASSPTVATVEGTLVPTPAPDGPMPPPVTFPTAATDPVVVGTVAQVPTTPPTGNDVANTPEPASLTLLTLAGVGCLFRRRIAAPK